MKKYLLIPMLLLFLCSCTNKLYVADQDFERKYLSFIVDGSASREEVIMKLGEPSWVFENGRIFTYRVSIDSKNNIKPVRIDNDKMDQHFSYTSQFPIRYYSLVLIFSEKNLLEKHSLLLTNP